MKARQLYLDTKARSFVESPTSSAPVSSLLMYEGDAENIELYFLEPTSDFSNPYTYVNYSSGITATLQVGVITAAASVAAWSALSTTVTATASVVITGGSGLTEVQRITIAPKAVSGYYMLQLPARTVTVSAITTNAFTSAYHGLLDGQSVTLTAFTSPVGFSNGSVYFVRDRTRDTFKIANVASGTALDASASAGGTATLSAYTTAPLAAGADPAEVASALSTASTSSQQNIAANGTAEDYYLTYVGNYAGTDMPTVAITGSSLAGAPGLLGNLSLTGTSIANLVTAGNTEMTLEVDVFNGTLRHTYQTTARLGNDLNSAGGGGGGG